MELQKLTSFSPAFDKRDPNPHKNYGIHGVELRLLYGHADVGFVQFVLYTNWHLPHVQEEGFVTIERYPFTYIQQPQPADLGFPSPVPQYEGQTPSDKCDLLTAGTCYYDGSGLNAKRIYDVLVAEGSDGVWSELAEYHAKLFPVKVIS